MVAANSDKEARIGSDPMRLKEDRMSRRLLFVLCGVAGCGSDELASVNSERGELVVTILTTGKAVDVNGYLLHIDNQAPRRVPANGDVILQLYPGQHHVQITDIAGNCTPFGGSLVKFVAAGRQSTLHIEIQCPAPGTILVATGTTGSDPDQDGYLVVVNGSTPYEIPRNGEISIPGNRVGRALVELRGVAGNCAIEGDRARQVAIVEQGTSTVRFNLSCKGRAGYGPGEYLVVARRLSQTRDLDLYLLRADGTELEQLTDTPDEEYAPSISSAGDRIAFLRPDQIGGNLYLLDLATGRERQLPQRTDFPVSWSPDNATMAVNQHGRLQIVRTDGSIVSTPTDWIDGQPFWSRHGDRLAFSRGTNEGRNVFVIDRDGSDLRQVTRQGYREAGPWSPREDVILIRVSGAMACAFQGYPYPCTYAPGDLATLNLATGDELLIDTVYDEQTPAWTPDGNGVLFIAWDMGTPDLFATTLDGARVVNLTRSPALEEWFSIGRRQ